MNPNRNIYPWYKVCIEGVLHGPIIVLFVLSELNGTMKQLLICEALAVMLIVSLSIPTGILADKVNKKRCILIGSILNVIDLAIFALSTTFWHFAVANAIWAIGYSIRTGADSALIYNSFKESGQEEAFSKYIAGVSTMYFIAMIVGTTLGGLLANWNMRYALYGSFLCGLIGCLNAFRLKEPATKTEDSTSKELLVHALREIITNIHLRKVMVFGMVFTAALKVGFLNYNPYFEVTKLPIWAYGAIFALFNLTAAASSYAIRRLNGKKEHRKMVYWIAYSLTIASFLLLGYTHAVYGCLLICLHQVGRGLWGPLKTEIINHEGTDERLSTINSSIDTAELLFHALILGMFGLFLGGIGPMGQFHALFIGLSILGGIVLLTHKNTH